MTIIENTRRGVARAVADSAPTLIVSAAARQSSFAEFAAPRRRMFGVVRDLVGGPGASVVSLMRGGSEQAPVRLVDPVTGAAFDVGRRVPNETWREQPLRCRPQCRGRLAR